jgi:nucleotidyltransferase substrate binding protein (TIGR01987 family)
MTKFSSVFEDYKKALKKLDEILREEKTEIVRDSAIQRFHITFELAWKVVKAYVEDYLKVRCASPKSCFRELFNQGIVEYDDMWMEIADWRNEVVHTYKEELADELYANLPKALEKFKELERRIKEEVED